ncbi:hypothetical protein AB0M22_22765 [Nocardia sp. NPDC051756]|uniref:hypothetical protein n=1 Tax=Nocardia sp. NPDC051756 TaxID=3154751 RepID=UPI00341804F3
MRDEPPRGAVLFPVEPVALRDLVQRSGMGFSDVVALAEVPATTLNRLWKDPGWNAKASGATLHQLVAVVPLLAEYLAGVGFTARAERHLRVLAAAGIEVRFPSRVEADETTALSNALGVAAAISQGGRGELLRRLGLGWNLGHDRFIDALFDPGPESLISTGGEQLLSEAAAVQAAAQQTFSVSDMVGSGVLAHKLTKYGALEGDRKYSEQTMHSAFAHRSQVIGGLLRDDDMDLMRRYRREVEADPLLVRNERWSLLTFGSGQQLPKDFSLPAIAPSVYTEIVRDAVTLNESYLMYLTSVAVPGLCSIRPLEASVRKRLAAAFAERLSAGISDAELRRDVSALHRRLLG